MSEARPTLHLLCGKVAAGKSTLASELCAAEATVLLAEDAWLAALYPDELQTLVDYVHYSQRLQKIIGQHVLALLGAGVSVVLDFPANTIANRVWMKGIVDQAGTAHRLHVLDTPDEICLSRLHARNATEEHEFAVTEEQFRAISAHFVLPEDDEGFEIEWHRLATDA